MPEDGRAYEARSGNGNHDEQLLRLRKAVADAVDVGADKHKRVEALRLTRLFAWRVTRAHYGSVLGALVCRLLLLAASAGLLYIALCMLSGYYKWIALAGAACVLVFGWLPMQTYVSGHACMLAGASQRARRSRQYTWWRLFRLSFLRTLQGLAWLVPCAALYTVLFLMLKSDNGMKMMQWLQNLFDWMAPGKALLPGLLILLVLIVLTFFLFLFGWNRGMPVEFQPVGSIGVKNSLARARRVRRKGKRLLRRAFLTNALLCAPFVLAVFALAALDVAEQFRMSSNSLMKLTTLINRLLGDFSPWLLWAIPIAYLVLALPTAPYRKTLNAALVHALGRAEHNAREKSYEPKPNEHAEA